MMHKDTVFRPYRFDEPLELYNHSAEESIIYGEPPMKPVHLPQMSDNDMHFEMNATMGTMGTMGTHMGMGHMNTLHFDEPTQMKPHYH